MSVEALDDHLRSDATHVCHCWLLRRRDGIEYGFTDHDRSLAFENVEFLPDSGLSAKAIASTTGLSVNNTEALGMLNAASITEADIDAGRFGGAEVTLWLVRWDDTSAREIQFYGTIGEITREAGIFRAELRGLTEMLNQEQGRAYLRSCSSVLGDQGCSVDTNDPAFHAVAQITAVEDQQVFEMSLSTPFSDRWFEAGSFKVTTGAASGLLESIKSDEVMNGVRHITLWQPLRAEVMVGDSVRLVAGCDKRSETCRIKFNNMINFQGFPDIPGDDWLMSVPRSTDPSEGGSLIRDLL